MADRRSRPRAGLTREKVLDAALDLVDTQGLPALSMRKLGAGLGVEGMTLYHYFPSKTALLDSLVERVFALALAEAPPQSAPPEMSPPGTSPPGTSPPGTSPPGTSPPGTSPPGTSPPGTSPPGSPPVEGEPWTEWLHRFARSMRATLLRHPGTLTLVATRPVSTPESVRMLERALSRLRSSGLSLGRSMDVINAVATFVVGHTLAEVGQTPGHEGTEPDPRQPAAPLDPTEFPHFAEALATGRGLDFDSRFDTTLRVLLSGYAALPDAQP